MHPCMHLNSRMHVFLHILAIGQILLEKDRLPLPSLDAYYISAQLPANLYVFYIGTSNAMSVEEGHFNMCQIISTRT